MALQALLFDVDGTLADTEKDGHRVAFNLAFEEAGLDWHWDEALYGQLLAVTGGKERIRYFLDRFHTDFTRPGDFDGFVKGLHAAKTRFYTQLLSEGRIPLRPGVERLIHEARDAGVRMAVVTTTTPANVTALLTHTLGQNAETWFEVIAAGDIVPAKKPAPDIYDWTLRNMDLTPEQCLAFEDSDNGIRSALAAQVPTLVTINDYTRDDDFSKALLTLSDLGEPETPYQVLGGRCAELGRQHPYVNLSVLEQLMRAASEATSD
ncbi:HAD family hydrolase [Thiomicrospira sp. WB1]|uniref:HAD family hydrolase n=1 Tax=Thiomicrospira sp. WB1 TaxID=1685380 RepID=UPI0007491108|nr:HAD family hydrolase [Thiomicrospira sp. WB1]KUJ72066.1 phosphatase [Thiomicrospira sp. WB1]